MSFVIMTEDSRGVSGKQPVDSLVAASLAWLKSAPRPLRHVCLALLFAGFAILLYQRFEAYPRTTLKRFCPHQFPSALESSTLSPKQSRLSADQSAEPLLTAFHRFWGFDNGGSTTGSLKARGNEPLRKSQFVADKALLQAPLDSASDQQLKRLDEQFESVTTQAQCKMSLVEYWLGQYYAAVSLAMICAAVVALTVFYFSKVGFDKASRRHPWTVTIFAMASALLAFYGSFPGVFRQDENRVSHAKAYLGYAALADAMLSYKATGLNRSGARVAPSLFIIEVDARLNELNNLDIVFDAEKVSKAVVAVPSQ